VGAGVMSSNSLQSQFSNLLKFEETIFGMGSDF